MAKITRRDDFCIEVVSETRRLLIKCSAETAMNLLLHTIALEPARWTSERVSRPLVEFLPAIAAADFRALEIYEPHLVTARSPEELRDAFESHGVKPEILSSYLDWRHARSAPAAFRADLDDLAKRIEFYHFQKVRLFPWSAPDLADSRHAFESSMRTIADRLPQTDLLLETHDGSFADDSRLILKLTEEIGRPNVGLLYQPTVFEPAAALEQFGLQRDWIRHLHLQNRHPDQTFATLEAGVVRWNEILADVSDGVNATLEFVPAGICSVAEFDLATVLRQAAAEFEYIRSIASAN